MAKDEGPTRVVCVGGGWTAVYLVKALRRQVRAGEVDLVVISRDTFHTMHGFMAEMLTGRIQVNQIMSPARRVFRPARFQHAEVTGFDLGRKVVLASRLLDGKEIELPYDHLVIGLGTCDDLGRYAGAEEHALRLRSYTDALTARNHIIGMLEMADLEHDPEERRRLLTFVVVGGGYGGVEVATELHDFCHQVIRRDYPRIAAEDIRVVLAHSGPDVLTDLLPKHASLQRYAQDYLDSTSLERRPATRIAAATPAEAVLDDGTRIPTRTIISCTGMGVPQVVEDLRVAKDERGRIITDATLRVPGADGVWAGGDNAAVPHPKGGSCPGLAIYAMRHGRAIGRNIAALASGRAPKAFTFDSFGDACSLGRRRAVATLFGLRFRGRLAWVMWRAVFLGYVPLWDRRIRMVLDWVLQPMVGRELAQLQASASVGMRRELYEPGQVIVHEGDVGRDLHLVWSGEVEVVRTDADGREERLATLGVGDHFGEVSVFTGTRRTATVRAITRVELLTLGREETLSLARTVQPLGDALRRRMAADVTQPPERPGSAAPTADPHLHIDERTEPTIPRAEPAS